MKKLGRPFVNSILFVASLTFLFESARASAWSDDLKLKIDENVKRNFQNQSQVGIVVGVIKGSEIHFWSYGEKLKGGGVSPDADTYFEMGSITKTYTATLLALEVQKGTVSLKDPISKFWKELGGTDAGNVTFEELATHTSGFPRMPANFVQSDPLDPYRDYDADLLFQFLKDFKQTKPGPHPYAYSNVGLGALGYILAQKMNSQTYADYLESNLLKPLGLRATKTQLMPTNLTNAAQGYDSFFSVMPFWNLNVLDGAGVLKTTARDLLRFLEFNMNADSSPIGRAMSLAHTQLGPSDTAGTSVGLVWGGTTLGRHSVISHGGATGGYRANLVFDKSEKLGAVVLSNTDVAPACILSPVFDVPCVIPNYVEVQPATHARLVGQFESLQIGLKAEVFARGAQLGIHPDGQPQLKLWPKSDFEYFIPDAKAEVVFTLPATGDVTEFQLRQGGQTFLFTRALRP